MACNVVSIFIKVVLNGGVVFVKVVSNVMVFIKMVSNGWWSL